MPIVVRFSWLNRWSIAFAAIVFLSVATATFAVASSYFGWLTGDQVSGIGVSLLFAALIAYVYVAMNWIESGGWSWTRIEDDRCLEVARRFMQRLTDGDFEGAFELTDAAEFGEPQRDFARWVAAKIENRTLVAIRETPPAWANYGIVPVRYRRFAGPFALVDAEFDESPERVSYVPVLRLVLQNDRYVVQEIETLVMGHPCGDEN